MPDEAFLAQADLNLPDRRQALYQAVRPEPRASALYHSSTMRETASRGSANRKAARPSSIRRVADPSI